MKKATIILFFILLFPFAVFAAPAKQNNKVGVSLLQPTTDDIKAAAEMINGNGGDYGYVTLVIQENDRNYGKWQTIFDQLRKYHLIPIVRLATKPEGENWRRPNKEDADEWVRFLSSLNWVTQEKYIVLFNEPNHATEWGGEVDTKGYAEIFLEFSKKLHEKSSDYFIMMAGFDASAPSYPNQYEDEEIFLREMINFQPSIFNNIDGWASHSYANPGFSGSPWETGRKSVRGYEWEQELLKSLGVSKELPVFITETGWRNSCQLSVISCQLKIAENYKTAFENTWMQDERVVAVTPFVFNYQSEPFLGFSFKEQGKDSFYPQYESVKNITKAQGAPIIMERGELTHNLPGEFVANSSFHFTFKLKNTGQTIWDKDEGYRLSFSGDRQVPFEYFFSDIKNLEPFMETEISLFLKTNNTDGLHKVTIALYKNETPIAQTDKWEFTVVPLPKLNVKVSLFPKVFDNNKEGEIQIFDEHEGLIYKKKGIRLAGGEGIVEEVQNIVFGKKYRMVILVPYYLPRQVVLTFKQGNNTVSFKPLLPFDLNRDGKFTLDDVGEVFKHPNLLGLFVP